MFVLAESGMSSAAEILRLFLLTNRSYDTFRFLFERGILTVDVFEETDATVFEDNGGAIHDPNRNGVREYDTQRFVAVHRSVNALFVPAEVFVQEPYGKRDRIFHSNTTMTEIAA